MSVCDPRMKNNVFGANITTKNDIANNINGDAK